MNVDQWYQSVENKGWGEKGVYQSLPAWMIRHEDEVIEYFMYPETFLQKIGSRYPDLRFKQCYFQYDPDIDDIIERFCLECTMEGHTIRLWVAQRGTSFEAGDMECNLRATGENVASLKETLIELVRKSIDAFQTHSIHRLTYVTNTRKLYFRSTGIELDHKDIM